MLAEIDYPSSFVFKVENNGVILRDFKKRYLRFWRNLHTTKMSTILIIFCNSQLTPVASLLTPLADKFRINALIYIP